MALWLGREEVGVSQFDDKERAALMAVKGVGPTVIARLEGLGIADLATLADQDGDAICAMVSAQLGATCWKNSPQARRALAAAIDCAKAYRMPE